MLANWQSVTAEKNYLGGSPNWPPPWPLPVRFLTVGRVRWILPQTPRELRFLKGGAYVAMN